MSKSIHVYNGSWLGLCLLSAILAGGCQEYGGATEKSRSNPIRRAQRRMSFPIRSG